MESSKRRHCEEASPTKQSRANGTLRVAGLLRFARNDRLFQLKGDPLWRLFRRHFLTSWRRSASAVPHHLAKLAHRGRVLGESEGAALLDLAERAQQGAESHAREQPAQADAFNA